MPEAATKRVRTCITCGVKQDKVTLHRVVRTKEGEILYDQTGRKAGRGAYVCSGECLKKALSTGKLNRALRTSLNARQIEELTNDMTGIAPAPGSTNSKEQ